MKKWLSMLLCAVMLLSLYACGGAGAKETETAPTEPAAAGDFRVGYGITNITPKESVPLGGYGRSLARMSKGFISYLYAICIAVTDSENNTILMYSLDLGGTNHAGRFRNAISLETGIPVENIVLSATHTHSAPDLTATSSEPLKNYLDLLEKELVNAAVLALEDRLPAQMSGGTIETKGLNFVRHYICKDGTYAGDNFGDGSSGYAWHVSDADPVLQLLKFTREGGKDIYLTNFQTHPHRTGGSTKYDISADIVGECRSVLESELDCLAVYFSGAGGNINPTSRITEENITADFREHGRALAEYAMKVELTPIATGKVQARTYQFEGTVDHTYDAYGQFCKELRAKWDTGKISTEELQSLSAAAGIPLNSANHATAIYTRSTLGATETFELTAFSFGDVGFVAAPYEMFDTNGVFIKEESPFDFTIIATICNVGRGYFPAEENFAYDNYETDTTKYVKGTAEEMADCFLSMLRDEYENR